MTGPTDGHSPAYKAKLALSHDGAGVLGADVLAVPMRAVQFQGDMRIFNGIAGWAETTYRYANGEQTVYTVNGYVIHVGDWFVWNELGSFVVENQLFVEVVNGKGA